MCPYQEKILLVVVLQSRHGFIFYFYRTPCASLNVVNIYFLVLQERELGTLVAAHHGAADRSGHSETELQQAGTLYTVQQGWTPDIRPFTSTRSDMKFYVRQGWQKNHQVFFSRQKITVQLPRGVFSLVF